MNRTKDKYYILDQVNNYIHRNRLQKGDRLPSEREMADIIGISRTKLRDALKKIDGKILERRGQAGTYIMSRPDTINHISPRCQRQRHNLISAMILSNDYNLTHQQKFIHDYLLERNCILNTYLPGKDRQALEKEKAFLESLLNINPRGLLAVASPFKPTNNRIFDHLASEGTIVTHLEHYEMELPKQPFFLPDWEAAGFAAVNYFAMRGVKKVALALFHNAVTTKLIKRGIENAIAMSGLEIMDEKVPASKTATGTPESARIYSGLNKDTGIIIDGFAGAGTVFAELKRVQVDNMKSIPAIVLGDSDEITDTPFPEDTPVLTFSWRKRVVDAMEYILSDGNSTRNILYKPVFMETRDNSVQQGVLKEDFVE